MAQRLTIDEILTVGFVDRGDDPEAEIVFFKRKDGEMSEVQEKEPGLKDRVLALMKSIAGMQDEDVDRLLAEGVDGGSVNDTDPNRNGDGHMTFDVTKLSDEERVAFDAAVEAAVRERMGDQAEPVIETPEDMPESVSKAFDQAREIAKAAEDRAADLEKRLSVIVEQRENEAYIAKVHALNLPGAHPDDFAPILRKAEKALTDDERAKFTEVLHQVSKAVQEGVLYEVGQDSTTPTSAEAEVDEIAKSLVSEDPSLSLELARGKAWALNPHLYQRHREEMVGKEG